MDEQKLREIFDKLFEEKNQIEMQLLHRVWFRNILYYLGEQWFEWVRGQNTFRRIMPSPYLPTPVANIVRDYVRSMKSLILNKDYGVNIWPNSNDLDDREAADMGESFLRWLETMDDERYIDEKEKIAIWLVLCGTSFDRTFVSMEDDGWMFDKSGNPIQTGNVASMCLSPFAVRLDSYGQTLRQKRFVGVKDLRPKEWVEDTFKVKVGGGGDEALIDYERQLARLVANVSPWKGDGLEFTQGSVLDTDDLVLFKEVEVRPTRENPQGVYAAMVGDQIIFNYNRLPIKVSKDGKWDYSLTDFHYHFVPGRFWSDPGVNDLISPQNTINQIDQDLEINRKGVGRPIILVPTDVDLQKLTKFGQSLLVVKYDALLSGGAKPEIGRGTPLPSQVLEERAIHLQNAQDAAGDPRNVLRGKAPTTQASGVMVDILRDAAEQGHLPDIDRFYRAHKRVKRKQLILAQEVYTEERMIKVPDQGGRPKVLKFKGADIRNNTDVRIELASGAASTRAGQTNMILKLVEQQFFSPENIMPAEFKQEILRRVGLSGFRDKTNVDAQRAMAENERVANLPPDEMKVIKLSDQQSGQQLEIAVVEGLFAAMGGGDSGGEGMVLENDPAFRYDNHQVHYDIHRNFFMSNEFKHMDRALQDALMVHADYHKWILDQQAMQAQQQAMDQAATMEVMKAAKLAEAGIGPGAAPPAPGGNGGAMPPTAGPEAMMPDPLSMG